MHILLFFIAFVLTCLGVIIAFENVMMIVPVLIGFSQRAMPLFFPLIMMFLLGLGAGICYVYSFQGMFKKTDKEDYTYMDDV